MKTQRGYIVDVFNKKIFKGRVDYDVNGILRIVEEKNDVDEYILPGFVDSHIHIESTMLSPSEFARNVVSCGTVGVVADPHEIANVCGVEGLDYMQRSADNVPLKISYGVPSCVPATPFEVNGAEINSNDINRLFESGKYNFLGEFMNVPGVINKDKEVLAKIYAARKFNYPIDGHAPGLSGDELGKYISAGISTDHEYFSYENTIEKINRGLKIQIREGSASKDFDNLYSLIDMYPNDVMLCTDDSHPYDLLNYGHIDKIVRMAIKKDLNLFNILKVACVNPVFHYNLDIGLLRVNDKSDFIVVDNLKDFRVIKTVLDGDTVFENGESRICFDKIPVVNNFNAKPINLSNISVKDLDRNIKVIDIEDGSLVSHKLIIKPKVENNCIVSDTKRDVLKMVLVNRYKDIPVQVGFIRGFGLKEGAIASSIGHDSHNILSIGMNDADIICAVNSLIEIKGGIATSVNEDVETLTLDIAGLMSDKDIKYVNESYERLVNNSKEMGTRLNSPFMTMAFMSLVVIPELKLGSKGLFEFSKFDFVNLYE